MAVILLRIVSVLWQTLLILLLHVSSLAQSPHLVSDEGSVWVRDIDPEVLYTFTRYFNTAQDWRSVFPVTMKGSGNSVALAGDYTVYENAVRFTPRFPFVKGGSYVATFHSEQLALNTNEVYLPAMCAESLTLEFSIEPVSAKPPTLIAIHPSSEQIPENLLKIHLTFSKSMTVGNVYSHLKLYDDKGELVEKPFLIFDQELWDDEMKTVTILLDPGRIKRGLRPNLEMKPALTAGRQYTLEVGAGWRDIDGLHTGRTYSKTFNCIAADRQSPTIEGYEVIAPTSPTAPLILDMNGPHDFIMLMNSIRVYDALGNKVEGAIMAGADDSRVHFAPKNPWIESVYTIHVNPLLEDLAGNNLKRLFDEDLNTSKAENQTTHQLVFKFSKLQH